MEKSRGASRNDVHSHQPRQRHEQRGTGADEGVGSQPSHVLLDLALQPDGDSQDQSNTDMEIQSARAFPSYGSMWIKTPATSGTAARMAPLTLPLRIWASRSGSVSSA